MLIWGKWVLPDPFSQPKVDAESLTISKSWVVKTGWWLPAHLPAGVETPGFGNITICECEISTEDGLLEKEGCAVTVENLVIALDCDECEAFTENDTRPDIISVRECEHRYQWLIIEMKSTMRPRAADQARAALERLGCDPMFGVDLDDAHVIFVIKNRRKADNTLMREIGAIEVGQWRVVPRLHKSGSIVRCKQGPHS